MKNLVMILFGLVFAVACSSSSDGGSGGDNGFGGKGKPGGGGGGDAQVNVNGQVNLQGTWKGTGSASGQGQQVACNEVIFQFEQTNTTLKVVRGDFSCEQGYNPSWDTEEVQIDGNTVKQGGQQIGTLSVDTLAISDGGNYTVTLRRNGNSLQITEVYQADGITHRASLTLQ